MLLMMRFITPQLLLVPVLGLGFSGSTRFWGDAALAAEPLLKPNDRVALVGGAFVERMQSCGSFEAELQCRRPDWKLSFRNLGWSGDDVHGVARKRFDLPESGFQRLCGDVQTADPTVIVVAYGSVEASDGEAAVSRFESGLRRLVDELRRSTPRVILMAPVAMPGFRVEGYQHWIGECRLIMERVGTDCGLPVIKIDWTPTAATLTEDKLLPNPRGYGEMAAAAAKFLVGETETGDASEELRRRIIRKNQLFFHRYRPQNETYLFLFRQHEQAHNAAEIAQFDPLIQSADEAIWQAAGT